MLLSASSLPPFPQNETVFWLPSLGAKSKNNIFSAFQLHLTKEFSWANKARLLGTYLHSCLPLRVLPSLPGAIVPPQKWICSLRREYIFMAFTGFVLFLLSWLCHFIFLEIEWLHVQRIIFCNANWFIPLLSKVPLSSAQRSELSCSTGNGIFLYSQVNIRQ